MKWTYASFIIVDDIKADIIYSLMHTVAEIGINHNGDINIAKSLIQIAKKTGFTHVKLQKRNPDIAVPDSQKGIPKITPWGVMSYINYKHRLEFNEEQIRELVQFSESLDITFFASVWDIDSVDIMKKFTSIGKIPSAKITDIALCRYARQSFDTLIISTGMSTEDEIETCVQMCNPDIIMHTNSTYPTPADELNLNYITWLKVKYPDKIIGYSGHELTIATTTAAFVLGARWIERHVTLDKNMWGSDQSASLDPDQMEQLINDLNSVQMALQKNAGPRTVTSNEKSKLLTLRGL